MCCKPFAFSPLQIGRLEAALEDVVQDRRGEVHDGRQENAAVDENVREAKGGEHIARNKHLAHFESRFAQVYLRRQWNDAIMKDRYEL